jgi:hypothetical protein
MLHRVVWWILTDDPEVLAASNNTYQTTRRNIPEDSNLYTLRRENLKCHQQKSPSSTQTSFPQSSFIY